MSSSFAIYETLFWAVPFVMFAVIFLIMSILNKRAHSYAVEHVLGIKLKSSKSKTESLETRSSDDGSTERPVTIVPNESINNNQVKVWSLQQHTETFLYIEQEDEVQKKEGLPCILRLLCDLFTSAILTILLEIIFLQCILSNQTVLTNSSCPDFDADCFSTYNGTLLGPFSCTKNAIANFSTDSPTLDCFGWVYKTTSTIDVLNAIGVSGGLLGLVSSIVPLVYYLSYFEKPFRCMSWLGVIPLLGVWAGFLCFIFITHPKQPVLTVLTCLLLIGMIYVGWGWAFYKTWPHSRIWSNERIWIRKCCGPRCCFFTLYPYYPICCCGKPERYSCFDVNISP
ncbi:unnamed protein product [Adineta steineri]|uniref:Uncharacterized protein n=1 Tax=Adineta steineri TaxID=433720 RepID=A0A819VTU2_9BILA|nr:unnamed protein product [Adineta steineri]CAF1435265.1 unnamed protein product [Adineta steineri]CAF4114178.1 unnamed protein product [Adineta steineri]CAF4118338.1 unnamed protein product [Adineta steineri]